MTYEKPKMEVIEWKLLDVIKTSDPTQTVKPLPGGDDDNGLEGDF